MSADPFANANMAAWGSQMAKAWQDGIETWWKALLGDPARLGELAARLGKIGAGLSTDAGDMARVLTALELLEGRVQRVEKQVLSLAENLAQIVRHLDKAAQGSAE
jgi:hypothetical protein